MYTQNFPNLESDYGGCELCRDLRESIFRPLVIDVAHFVQRFITLTTVTWACKFLTMQTNYSKNSSSSLILVITKVFNQSNRANEKYVVLYSALQSLAKVATWQLDPEY